MICASEYIRYSGGQNERERLSQAIGLSRRQAPEGAMPPHPAQVVNVQVNVPSLDATLRVRECATQGVYDEKGYHVAASDHETLGNEDRERAQGLLLSFLMSSFSNEGTLRCMSGWI